MQQQSLNIELLQGTANRHPIDIFFYRHAKSAKTMKSSPLRYTMVYTVLLLLLLLLWLFSGDQLGADGDANVDTNSLSENLMNPTSDADDRSVTTRTDGENSQGAGYAYAVFAGGCFWCMEPPYDKLDGVIETISGYAGGHTEDPSYEDVVAGGTGHAEVVKVVYDPGRISYAELLDVYWKNIDPTSKDRQFCDVGDQYRTAIFYADDEQRQQAEASLAKISATADLPGPVMTRIEPLNAFYPAEHYHQDYYRKNPLRYKLYRSGCGRDARLRQLWGEQ